jgi:type IV pilus assembly protein PilB
MLLSSSQRLVRKLCPNCAHAVSVDDRVRKTFSDAKVDLSPRATHVFVPADGGCDECNKIGYKGRALVLEFLRFNDEMRAMIHRGETMQALRETAARAMGYRSLYQKGLELVSAGITSLEEVQAVCRR